MIKNILIFCLLFLCSNQAQAQCNYYSCKMELARTALQEGNYKSALDHARGAENYDATKKAEVNAFIDKVFTAIEKKKNEAEDGERKVKVLLTETEKAKNEAKIALLETEKAKLKADSALYKAEKAKNEAKAALIETQKAKAKADSALQIERKLTSLFYFSTNGVAPILVKNIFTFGIHDLNPFTEKPESMAYKHFWKQNRREYLNIYAFPFVFRYIDRQANLIDSLGIWVQAEPFSSLNTGWFSSPLNFAKVTDGKGITFLLTPEGDIYRFDYENFQENEILILDNIGYHRYSYEAFERNYILENSKNAPNFINKYKNLKLLYVNGSSYDISEVFENNQMIHTLFLKELGISDEHKEIFDSIGNLKNLKNLDLSSNNISKIAIQLANLKKLQKLNLTNTPISDSEIENAKKFLPKGCEVIPF